MDSQSRLDRWVIGASLLTLVVLSWFYLLLMDAGMRAMRGAGGTDRFMWLMPMGRWDAVEFALGFAMWLIMMVGMMIPSAAPVILLYAKVWRKAQERGAYTYVTAFVLGYLAIWSAFSLAATALQYLLTELRWYSDAMESENIWLSSSVLILAGLYQFTAFKHACLKQCQSPLGFVTRQWRDGYDGAFRMGVKHGWYCLGCCWMIMLVLFAVGVMNLLWIALLSAIVLFEKLAPGQRWFSDGIAVLLIAFGALKMVHAV